LTTVHHIDKTKKFKQEMIAHMDGRDWFSTTYKLTSEEGLVIFNTVRCTRAKDDMMRYA
jgi:hypothetical protein